MDNELRREILQFAADKCDSKHEQRAKLSDFSEKFPELTEFDLMINISYAVRDKLLVADNDLGGYKIHRPTPKGYVWLNGNRESDVSNQVAASVESTVTEQQDVLATLKQQFNQMENKQDEGQKTANLGIRLAILGFLITIVSAALFSGVFWDWMLSWFH